VSTMKIVVCDDDFERGQSWAAQISAVIGSAVDATATAIAPHRFAEAFVELEARRLSARKADAAEDQLLSTLSTPGSAVEIDEADLVVVDYDLTPDTGRTQDPEDDKGAVRGLVGRSGEEFVYLARFFSSAKAFAVVNQTVQSKTFDLSLRRFAHSLADVNVTAHDLRRRSLWLGSGDTFRPWSWPVLLDLPTLAEERSRLLSDPGQLIVDALHLGDTDDLNSFTQAQLDSLGADLMTATILSVATESPHGLKGHDKKLAETNEVLAGRAAINAIYRWLSASVVPAQNVLVDAPHLAQRFPILVNGDRSDPATWNQLTSGDVSAVLRAADLESALSPASAWIGRPLWSLARASAIARALGRVPTGEPTFVFCEDTSRFIEIAHATEFESGVSGPYVQRFVERVSDLDYAPRGRLR
jgi:hypothetical protein